MHSTYEELACIYVWLHLLQEARGLQTCRLVGPTWTTGISRLTFWSKKNPMVICLRTRGLPFIFLVRLMPQKGGRGELLSPSPPAAIGGSICKTLPSWAQHTQDLRRFHFQRDPKDMKINEKQKQKYPRYTSDRYCRPRPNRAFRLLSPISAHGLIQAERNRSFSQPKPHGTNS